MGCDYAFVHLKYNIPPALILTFLYEPLFTKLDLYRIIFLITVAVVYTTPWDSYLIQQSIWTYPTHVVIGPKLFQIPLEEVFFFIIQTYNTSLIYLLFSKSTFQPAYLRHESTHDKLKYFRLIGQVLLAFLFRYAFSMASVTGPGTYLGLILIWGIPVLGLLWSLAYQFILKLPWTNVLLPITLPTLYLWIVDTLALKRGTWVIETDTKLNVHIWPHLEIEEALFFLLTNTLIVFGLVAFDNAMAILHTFPSYFPKVPDLPSPAMLVRALLLPAAAYDASRIEGFKESIDRLAKKSRSFSQASAVFEGRLKCDIILLYSYCRVADDLVDTAPSVDEARNRIEKLRRFLDLSYKPEDAKVSEFNVDALLHYIIQNFPSDTQSALIHLPTDRLPSKPLYDLLTGFEMDLQFQPGKHSGSDKASLPIKTEDDLNTYSQYVAGTIGELCLALCFYHYPGTTTEDERSELVRAGGKMGMVLQHINIARDIQVDAQLGRVYLPTSWLKKEKLTPVDIINALSAKNEKKKELDDHLAKKIEQLRSRMLDRAFELYDESRPAIEHLPIEVRASMRVAVESYVEIGRTLRRKGYVVRQGRATVPKWRRIAVAWKALRQ